MDEFLIIVMNLFGEKEWVKYSSKNVIYLVISFDMLFSGMYMLMYIDMEEDILDIKRV